MKLRKSDTLLVRSCVIGGMIYYFGYVTGFRGRLRMQETEDAGD